MFLEGFGEGADLQRDGEHPATLREALCRMQGQHFESRAEFCQASNLKIERGSLKS